MHTLLAVGRLLLVLEEAGLDFTGTVSIRSREGGLPGGQIFIDRGRLRWAVAPGFVTRLMPLLATEAGVGLEELQQRLRAGAESGSGLEETLRGLGNLDEVRVRRALLHHTAAAVTYLAVQVARGAARIAPPETMPLADPPARFAFAAQEILAEVFASDPDFSVQVPPLPLVFTECGPDHRSALCFLELDEPFLPALPVSSYGPFEGGLLWALDLLRQARRLRRGLFANEERNAPFAGVIRSGDRGWAVTYERPYFCIFRLGTAGEYGRILTQHRRSRLAAGLARA